MLSVKAHAKMLRKLTVPTCALTRPFLHKLRQNPLNTSQHEVPISLPAPAVHEPRARFSQNKLSTMKDYSERCALTLILFFTIFNTVHGFFDGLYCGNDNCYDGM